MERLSTDMYILKEVYPDIQKRSKFVAEYYDDEIVTKFILRVERMIRKHMKKMEHKINA